MTKRFCDRCGRETKNKASILIPCERDSASLSIDGQWFGEPITFCNLCIEDFNTFRYTHEHFNRNLEKDWN